MISAGPQTTSFLLLHPPVTRPCEPPAGVSRLAGTLISHGIACSVFDVNLHCLSAMLGRAPDLDDTWSRRAWAGVKSHLDSLRRRDTYKNMGRYRRAVQDINRLLNNAGVSEGFHIALTNFSSDKLSPLKSGDLIRSYHEPEKNPFFEAFSHAITEIIERSKPSIVGLSLNFLAQALTCFAMMGFVRKRYPGIRLIMGGGLVTSWMSRPGWRNPFGSLVDEMVCGPGEKRLLEIAGVKPHAYSGPPDYGWAVGNGYLSPGFVLPYSASTGCYWRRCSFCPEKAEKNPYHALGTNAVKTEIVGLVRLTAPLLIHFLDNAMSPDLLQAVASDKAVAPWYGFARISALLTNRDFAVSLRQSGCVMLKLGVESGDQHVLDEMGKGIEKETVSLALSTLKRAGIATYVYLLFGTPSEDEKRARNTLEFVAANAESIDYLSLAVFNMPALGKDADRYETRDFYEGDLALYKDFVHPLGWGRLEVRRFLDRIFKRHQAVATILRREAPFFTSSHAPFFSMAEKGML